MASIDAKKGGGGKLARSETVTVRLDPKLRYLAELAARTQRRTLSSFIEYAVERALTAQLLSVPGRDDFAASVAEEADALWDVDEADRFVKLAFRFPHLLTYDEQVLWKLICEHSYFWPVDSDTGQWSIKERSLSRGLLREAWGVLRAVAEGRLDRGQLPTWPEASTSRESKDKSHG